MDLVAGWTGRLDWRLVKDGLSMDLSSFTTCAVVLDRNGRIVSTTCAGAVEVVYATCGSVGFWPNVNTFQSSGSPYNIRFKVSDVSGASVYFPNGKSEPIIVRSA